MGVTPVSARPRGRRPRQGHAAVEVLKGNDEASFPTRDLDYSGSVAAFLNGEGGVYFAGTWMVGTFEAESRKPGRPLSGGYAVYPYPQLFPGRNVTYADGHPWAMRR